MTSVSSSFKSFPRDFLASPIFLRASSKSLIFLSLVISILKRSPRAPDDFLTKEGILATIFKPIDAPSETFKSMG